ncbi:MAG: hypothetical protein F2667_08180 [Actinobacteria bacterium]|nr:hypothetical protein [Actinomycetota bacterium]
MGGLLALVLVGSGVGVVYANTSADELAAGASTGTSTGTGTGTGTGTPSEPEVDKNGIRIDLKPGRRQVAGFSLNGKLISGTVVPTKSVYRKITAQFSPTSGKAAGRAKITRSVFARGERVAKFSVDKYGHLRFSTRKVDPLLGSIGKVSEKVTFKLTFKRTQKVKGELVTKTLTVTAKTPFKY